MSDRNPPYSMVCRNRHVLNDEIQDEPFFGNNERLRCSEGGCHAPVYSHCKACKTAIPGFMDGFRSRTSSGGGWSVTSSEGRSSLYGPSREFFVSCPNCASPYPWATSGELSEYHVEYLRDLERGVVAPLPLNSDAKAVYDQRTEIGKTRGKTARKEAKRSQKKERAERADQWFTRWTVRLGLLVAVITVATGLIGLWGVDDLRGIRGNAKPPTEPVAE